MVALEQARQDGPREQASRRLRLQVHEVEVETPPLVEPRHVLVDDRHSEAVQQQAAVALILDGRYQLALAARRAGAGEELGDGVPRPREDGRAVAVGDAADVRQEVLVLHHGNLGPEGGAVGGAGEVAPVAEVLCLGVAGEDLPQDALLHGVRVGGHFLDEAKLVGVHLFRRRRGRGTGRRRCLWLAQSVNPSSCVVSAGLGWKSRVVISPDAAAVVDIRCLCGARDGDDTRQDQAFRPKLG